MNIPSLPMEIQSSDRNFNPNVNKRQPQTFLHHNEENHNYEIYPENILKNMKRNSEATAVHLHALYVEPEENLIRHHLSIEMNKEVEVSFLKNYVKSKFFLK